MNSAPNANVVIHFSPAILRWHSILPVLSLSSDEQPNAATVPLAVNVSLPARCALACLLILGFADAGQAQTAPPKAAAEKAVQALDALFELGLPDTRGAKWVS